MESGRVREQVRRRGAQEDDASARLSSRPSWIERSKRDQCKDNRIFIARDEKDEEQTSGKSEKDLELSALKNARVDVAVANQEVPDRGDLIRVFLKN